MSKRKIGELYNKPIVEGDKNLIKGYEIHVDQLSGGGGNDWLYLDATEKISSNFQGLSWLFHIVTIGDSVIRNVSEYVSNGVLIGYGPIVGVGICLSALTNSRDNKLMTVGELLNTIDSSFGIPLKDVILQGCNLKEISKEEFLSLQTIPS